MEDQNIYEEDENKLGVKYFNVEDEECVLKVLGLKYSFKKK